MFDLLFFLLDCGIVGAEPETQSPDVESTVEIVDLTVFYDAVEFRHVLL